MLSSKVAKEVLFSSGGRFLTVVFQKKDGTRRVLNGRLGVTSQLHGGESKLDPNQYIIVWDKQARGYRAVNVDTIEEIHSNKMVIR